MPAGWVALLLFVRCLHSQGRLVFCGRGAWLVEEYTHCLFLLGWLGLVVLCFSQFLCMSWLRNAYVVELYIHATYCMYPLMGGYADAFSASDVTYLCDAWDSSRLSRLSTSA